MAPGIHPDAGALSFDSLVLEDSAAAQQPIFPTPGFEGSEKRIEIDFYASPNALGRGFRAVPRDQLDELCSLAQCCIVSHTNNELFDAYVLSESSLFVYPHKVIMKTCGTTTLLLAVPRMLELAAEHGMAPRRCKYSRLSYLWPTEQHPVHQTFDSEDAYLDKHFGSFGCGASSYVMGNGKKGGLWHVYVADAEGVAAPHESPTYTLEVCMTELDEECAAHYFRNENFVSSSEVTRRSGIGALFPTAEIDDYVFEPCGYSMNAVDDYALGTIHITPEAGFSYASCELSGYKHNDYDPSAQVRQIAQVFRPGVMSVAMSVDCLPERGSGSWDLPLAAPKGYTYAGGTSQIMSCGGRVTYHTFHLPTARAFAVAGAAEGVKEKVMERSPSLALASPHSTLSLWPSFSYESSEQDSSFRSSDSVDSDEEAMRSRSRSRSPSTGGSPDADPAAPPGGAIAAAKAAAKAHLAVAGAGAGPAALAGVAGEFGAEAIPRGGAAAVDAFARKVVGQHALEESFYVVDLGVVRRLHEAWVEMMPRITPFYAVKCNPDDAIIASLAACGAGFDCASVSEIEQVLRHGVDPSRIVFANPCKLPAHIRRARAEGVSLTTFDTVCELQKLARLDQGAGLLLRLRADDPDARCQLGNKYGAEPEDARELLESAASLGLRVVGVSFHVGSGATNPACFSRAIRAARDVFDAGLELGFSMAVLDIGGGFSGGTDGHGELVLGRVAQAVNRALDEHFPPSGGVRVIAEPGRYFVEAASTLYSNVFGKRTRTTPDEELQFDYWISDGLYGSFNCLLYDHAVLASRPLVMVPASKPVSLLRCASQANARVRASHAQEFTSTVFGPTCDGLDTVLRNVPLPELAEGDWMAFPAMGAYTCAAGSNFNGFKSSDALKFYIYSQGDE